MWLRELRRVLDLGDVKVVNHRVVAGAGLASMSEHVIEFVPVQRADDGIGFDTRLSRPGHYGLVGLRERVALLKRPPLTPAAMANPPKADKGALTQTLLVA